MFTFFYYSACIAPGSSSYSSDAQVVAFITSIVHYYSSIHKFAQAKEHLIQVWLED